MTRNKAKGARVAVAALAIAWLAVPAAATSDPEPGWRLRFSVAGIDFHNNARGSSGYDIDIGAALAVNAEYRFTRRLGLDLGALAGGGVDVVARRGWLGWTDVYDTMSLTALTAGLDIHLTPDNRVDLYVCPMVALMQYGGLVFETAAGRLSAGVDFDEDLALGAGFGLGVPFGEKQSWSFNANLTFLESRLDGRDRSGMRFAEDYDTTMFGLGFGYRF